MHISLILKHFKDLEDFLDNWDAPAVDKDAKPAPKKKAAKPKAEKVPVADKAPEAQPFIEAIKENLDVNIIPYIEAHPETTFTIFFPPYSILYWDCVNNRKELDVVIEKYRFMCEYLSAYKNVEIFFFQNNEEIICNLNNYADYTHYSPKICEYMVQCFADGSHKVTTDDYGTTMENVEKELEVLYDLTSDYDYEAIWDDWYN